MCFIKFKINAAIYQISEDFILSFAYKFYGDAEFILL